MCFSINSSMYKSGNSPEHKERQIECECAINYHLSIKNIL